MIEEWLKAKAVNIGFSGIAFKSSLAFTWNCQIFLKDFVKRFGGFAFYESISKFSQFKAC